MFFGVTFAMNYHCTGGAMGGALHPHPHQYSFLSLKFHNYGTKNFPLNFPIQILKI